MQLIQPKHDVPHFGIKYDRTWLLHAARDFLLTLILWLFLEKILHCATINEYWGFVASMMYEGGQGVSYLPPENEHNFFDAGDWFVSIPGTYLAMCLVVGEFRDTGTIFIMLGLWLFVCLGLLLVNLSMGRKIRVQHEWLSLQGY